MNLTSKRSMIFKRTRGIVTSLAAAAVLVAPAIAQKSALAENTDQVAAIEQPYLIQPSQTHPGYMLPPLSDHLIVAQSDQDEFALEEGGAAGDENLAIEEDDRTAAQYNRGYYEEPVQIAAFVLLPTTLEAVELADVSDDGTAQQFDRGYYKDPEMIVALIVVPLEDDQQ